MQIIRDKTTKIINYFFEDYQQVLLTSVKLKIPRAIILDANSRTHELLSVPDSEIPSDKGNSWYTYDNDTFTITDLGVQMLKQINLEEQERLVNQLASIRYAHETQGVNYTEDEVVYLISTDRDSVQILDSYAEKLRRGVITEVEWKCGSDLWLTINTTNIDAIELVVLTHIQTCFANEKTLQEAIKLDTKTDLYTGWPEL